MEDSSRMGRPDGVWVKNLPKYQLMMPYFMRTKAESWALYQALIKAENGILFAERMSKELGHKVTFFHFILHALFKTHVAYPDLNRFVKGGRIYRRNGIWFSFSVKKELSTKASVSVVKREFKPDFTLEDTVRAARRDIGESRSKKRDAAEREVRKYLWFPRSIIKMCFPFYKFRDEYGLLSAKYMKREVLFSSAFLANLGTFELDAAYHHLYEVGTCPLFLNIGVIEDRPVVEEEKIVARKILPIKITLDERVVDGFYYARGLAYFREQLENPEKLLEPAGLVE